MTQLVYPNASRPVAHYASGSGDRIERRIDGRSDWPRTSVPEVTLCTLWWLTLSLTGIVVFVRSDQIESTETDHQICVHLRCN